MSKPRIHSMRSSMRRMAEMIKKLCASCTDINAVKESKELVKEAEELLEESI